MPTARTASRLTRELCHLALLAAGAGAQAHDTGAPVPPAAAAAPQTYDPTARAGRLLSAGDVTIEVLLDAATLGSDVEMAVLTLPAGYAGSGAHAHRRLEIFYVLEGVLGHEVNGRLHELHAGQTGFVRAGDEVEHTARSPGPVRALVLWVPGGEADDLVQHAGFSERVSR